MHELKKRNRGSKLDRKRGKEQRKGMRMDIEIAEKNARNCRLVNLLNEHVSTADKSKFTRG